MTKKPENTPGPACIVIHYGNDEPYIVLDHKKRALWFDHPNKAAAFADEHFEDGFWQIVDANQTDKIAMQAEIDDLITQLDTSLEHTNDANKTIARQTKEIERLKGTHESRGELLGKATERIRTLTAKVSELEASLALSKAANQIREGEVTTITAQVEQLRACILESNASAEILLTHASKVKDNLPLGGLGDALSSSFTMIWGELQEVLRRNRAALAEIDESEVDKC